MARLPMRHQVVLWIVGVVACVGAGAWLVTSTADSLMWHYGALAGAVIGPVLVALYSRYLVASPATAPPPARPGSAGRTR